jgi:galactitol-specific phosphotransferase system IIC component
MSDTTVFNPNVERLTGGMLVVSQSAATLVLGGTGVGAGFVRLGVAVAFLLMGTVLLTKKGAAKGGAVAVLIVALGWSVYAGYTAGVDAVVYEVPVLALVGAVLVYHSTTRSEEK